MHAVSEKKGLDSCWLLPDLESNRHREGGVQNVCVYVVCDNVNLIYVSMLPHTHEAVCVCVSYLKSQNKRAWEKFTNRLEIKMYIKDTCG